MKNIKKVALYISLLFPVLAHAQSAEEWGINDFASGGVNLGTRSLRETIAGVVNIVLGFLGILATLLILFGGFSMMTSGGNADKKGKGQNAAVAGAIGLIIVLTAYAISRFVLASVANETVL